MSNSTLIRFSAATQHALTHKHSGYGCGRPVMQTGYYGRIDSDGRQRVSKTHVRLAGEYGPLCKTNLHPDMAFHWNANRAEMSYVECAACHSMLAKAVSDDSGSALLSNISFMTSCGTTHTQRDGLIISRGQNLREGNVEVARAQTLELLNV